MTELEARDRVIDNLEARVEDLMHENKRLYKELTLKCQADAVQIIDALYSRAGFDHWWGDLTQDLKEEVLEEITKVLREKI